MSNATALHKATNLSDVERRPHDFYATPAEVTQALIDAEGDALPRFIWEPAAGDGAMSRVLRGSPPDDRAVVESDIRPEAVGATVDFLTCFDRPSKACTAIVTNPPFKDCGGRMPWLWHAHKLGVEYMALLLPSGWAHASTRRPFLDVWSPVREWKIAWRIDWTGGGQSPANHSWFVWDRSQPRRAYWDTGVLYREGKA
jgi:hypothetical protein